MFNVDPSELMLVGVVALVVIGPKDLPKAMRFVGQWVGRARGMARHFRSGLDEMIRQAELDEMQKQWAATNARIMAEHPVEPIEEADDAAYAALPAPDAERTHDPVPAHDRPADHAVPAYDASKSQDWGGAASVQDLAGDHALTNHPSHETPPERHEPGDQPSSVHDDTRPSTSAEVEPELPMGPPADRRGAAA